MSTIFSKEYEIYYKWFSKCCDVLNFPVTLKRVQLQMPYYLYQFPLPKSFFIPKEKAMLCIFSFGITNLLGGGINRGNTVLYHQIFGYLGMSL